MPLKDAVRKVYLYLFSLVGLVLLIVSCISFLNMGLKAYVFTKADDQVRIDFDRPIEKPRFIENEVLSGEEEVTLTLTTSEKEQLRFIFEENERWEERQADIDLIIVNRHRQASQNVAMILIGLPLYLYHWFVIRRETKVVVSK